MNDSVLQDLLVVDMSEVFQAPLAAQVLGDFGADVVKVERPGVGDVMRNMDSHAVQTNQASCYFSAANRNKRSVAIDLKSPEGLAVLLRLIERADVLVHNYRPGVMQRLGLGYETLSKLNPRLIFASATGFGESGPLAHRPAQDMIAQSLSGIARAGVPADEPPRIMASPAVDYSSGMLLAQGVLLALLERARSGKGQEVQACLLNTAMAIQSAEAASLLMYGYETDWNRRGLSFVVRTLDGWVTVLGFFRPNPLRLFCQALGVADRSLEARFATLDLQIQNKAEISELMQAEAARYTTEQCVALFEAQDLICAPVLELRQALVHPQVLHNAMVEELPIEGQGMVKLAANPLRLSRTGPRTRRGPPLLAADSEGVLAQFGYGEEEIARLIESGVVGSRRGDQRHG